MSFRHGLIFVMLEVGLIILGLNAFHGDSSACLVRDGSLIAAVEEERFRRIKHWAGFPTEAIRYCLSEAGVSLQDVGHVAINQNSRSNILRKLAYVARSRPTLDVIKARVSNRRSRANVRELLTSEFPGQRFGGEVHHVDHHVAHLASAFHVSPFETCTVVSVDGFGDFASAAWGRGVGTSLSVEGQVYFPHSLGIFYQALTQYLGFPHYGDEYKVMGLAPYGELTKMREMRRIVQVQDDGRFELNLDYFSHQKTGVSYSWDGGVPHVGRLFTSELEDLLGPARRPEAPLEQEHRNLARCVQSMYEEAFFNLLRVLQQRHEASEIAIAGGCGMNSVANGKIRRETKYERVYVQAAAGDAGGAIGAAFSVWHKQGGKQRFRMEHAYWGPSFSNQEIADLLDARRGDMDRAGCELEGKTDLDALCVSTAADIASGRVVGWFQGRLEWGPRALGNRSILCDPRRANMKDVLNLKIKRRESFRPFAPSVMQEAVKDWFEESDDVPFMMQVFQIKAEKRTRIPAVTHVDGSGRLQSVSATANPRYYQLIHEFEKLTGVPMLLNTSFNENEPVVCTPNEALDCFLRTEMDVLVLGDFILRRREASV